MNNFQPFIDQLIDFFQEIHDQLLEYVRTLIPSIAKTGLDNIALIIIAGIVLLFLIKILFGKKENELILPPPGKRLNKKEKEKWKKIAGKEEEKEDYETAADIYRIIGDISKAVAAYIKANKKYMAADIAMENGFFELAAKIYDSLDKWDKSSEAWIQANNFNKAASILIKHNSFIKAAELLDQIKEYEKAGLAYEKGGYLERSSNEYIKAKKYGKAATLLHKEYMKQKKELKEEMNNPSVLEKLKNLALKTASYYEQDNMTEKAKKMYLEAGNKQKAAELSMKLEQWIDAAQLFQEANFPLKAAEIYEKIGETTLAAQLRASIYAKEGNELSAAENYIAGKEYSKAAEIFKKHGKYAQAAKLLEKNGDNVAAAEMYNAAGEFTKAAVSFENAGELNSALEMYDKLGNKDKIKEIMIKLGRYFEVFTVLIKEDKTKNAIELLKKIDKSDNNYFKAVAMLLNNMIKKNKIDEALVLLSKIDIKQSLHISNLDTFYKLARALEDRNEPKKALIIYKEFNNKNLVFNDAKERYKNLKEGLDINTGGNKKIESDSNKKSAEIKRYKIIKELGRGGMGVVYQAHDNNLDRIVALKVLPITMKDNPEAVKSFQKEAKATAALNHPNIVIVYDAGEMGNEYYISMEYIEGLTLRAYTRKKGPLSTIEILFLAVNIAKGLSYAHSLNIVHRDIKPANIMFDTAGRRIKIMDFGLYKVWQAVKGHNTMVAGTPYYMSPEQFLGNPTDNRTDIYSFGVTLFELATGKLPFRKGEIGYQHVHVDPPLPSEIHKSIDPKLEKIILKCMQKKAEERYQNADEIIKDFKELKSSL